MGGGEGDREGRGTDRKGEGEGGTGCCGCLGWGGPEWSFVVGRDDAAVGGMMELFPAVEWYRARRSMVGGMSHLRRDRSVMVALRTSRLIISSSLSEHSVAIHRLARIFSRLFVH